MDGEGDLTPNTNSLRGVEMDFRTLYSMEYTPKKGLTFPPMIPKVTSTVMDAYKQYLVPREDMSDRLPEDEPFEDIACVLHRAGKTGAPNLDVVRKACELANQSEYQSHYCKLGDYESEKSRASHHVPLPPNWNFCVTTHCGSYRVPQSIATFDLSPPKLEKRTDHLAINAMERDILRVKTGESDYMAKIGALGDFILREKLYGEVKRKGLNHWEFKRRLAMLEAGEIPLNSL